ncbi:MAG: hypothetical protein WC656_01235 [Sulfurimonas sp.]|jgi:hypothetical protein
MTAFMKIFSLIQNQILSGHAQRNIANVKSLTRANEEIKEVLEAKKNESTIR